MSEFTKRLTFETLSNEEQKEVKGGIITTDVEGV